MGTRKSTPMPALAAAITRKTSPQPLREYMVAVARRPALTPPKGDSLLFVRQIDITSRGRIRFLSLARGAEFAAVFFERDLDNVTRALKGFCGESRVWYIKDNRRTRHAGAIHYLNLYQYRAPRRKEAA